MATAGVFSASFHYKDARKRGAHSSCLLLATRFEPGRRMEHEERPGTAKATEEATGGGDVTAQGSTSRPSKVPARIKRCGYCNDRLPSDYSRPFCFKCIQKLAGKETSQVMKDFLSVQTQMLATLKEFQSSLRSREPEPQTSGGGSSSQESALTPRVVKRRPQPLKSLPSQGSEPEEDSDISDREVSDEGLVDSQAEDEEEGSRPGRHVFSADDMEGLLGAIYASEEIQEPAEQVSAQDRMYQGLLKSQPRTFPVHQALKDIILQEWKDPERKLLRPKTWKRRCPFKEEDEDRFFKTPRLDASLAQVSKQSDLSFEDTGNLKDQMDRRAETALRRAWEANAAAMSPALASACVARNADAWISKLTDHVSGTSKSKEVLESLQLIGSAVAYLADAAVETVRTTAKTGALLNSARRAVWVKTWDGDSASKTRLCGLPFEGSLLFGTGLDQALSRSTEKGKKFPTKPKKEKRRFFRGPQGKNRSSDKRPVNTRRWSAGKDKQKGGILFSNQKPNDKNSK